MAKYELKTKINDASVSKFISSIENESQKADCIVILAMMKEISKMEPKMYGSNIVGFGSYKYKYESGHEGEACLMGFSPRKQSTTLYIANHFPDSEELFKLLGKHKLSVACLYIKKLSDVDLDILKKLIAASFKYILSKYPDHKK